MPKRSGSVELETLFHEPITRNMETVSISKHVARPSRLGTQPCSLAGNLGSPKWNPEPYMFPRMDHCPNSQVSNVTGRSGCNWSANVSVVAAKSTGGHGSSTGVSRCFMFLRVENFSPVFEHGTHHGLVTAQLLESRSSPIALRAARSMRPSNLPSVCY